MYRTSVWCLFHQGSLWWPSWIGHCLRKSEWRVTVHQCIVGREAELSAADGRLHNLANIFDEWAALGGTHTWEGWCSAKLMSAGCEEEQRRPVTSLLRSAPTLEAETWDPVSMDRGVFIFLSMGAEWTICGLYPRAVNGWEASSALRHFLAFFWSFFPRDLSLLSKTTSKMSTSSPEAVKKLLENMQTDLRSLSMECKKKFPPVKEVSAAS